MVLEIQREEQPVTHNDHLPVAIIGAGPVGLAAAANLTERGTSFRLYEAGPTVGASVRDWGHVRIFTNWEQSVDPVSRRLPEAHGWKLPAPAKLPTGEEIYQNYLKPLSELPDLCSHVAMGARVVAITRKGIDKVTCKDRNKRPFELRIADSIDASGTWHNPNPLGGSGLPVRGETAFAADLAYGMPDVHGTQRSRYAGKRVAVVGAGNSAINVLLDLVRPGDEEGRHDFLWVVRGRNMARIYGGGEADELVARGRLGQHLKSLVERRFVKLVTGFSTESIERAADGLVLKGEAGQGILMLPPVDEVIVSTGQRPDLTMTRELRLELDPWLESVKALGPLIDPNVHSCGSVPPHGYRETSHPEPGFYTVGVKSYGPAPTFLLLTGYEQARSVAAALAGDMEAADNVHLVLPDTGVCITDYLEADANCRGGPAPAEADARCLADAVTQESGREGCCCGVAA
jgi:hypothetical protein